MKPKIQEENVSPLMAAEKSKDSCNPYGDEHRKYMMTLPKKFIIDLLIQQIHIRNDAESHNFRLAQQLEAKEKELLRYS